MSYGLMPIGMMPMGYAIEKFGSQIAVGIFGVILLIFSVLYLFFVQSVRKFK